MYLNVWPGLTKAADGFALTRCSSTSGVSARASLLYRLSASAEKMYGYRPAFAVSIGIVAEPGRVELLAVDGAGARGGPVPDLVLDVVRRRAWNIHPVSTSYKRPAF